jgi:hypothetical protein
MPCRRLALRAHEPGKKERIKIRKDHLKSASAATDTNVFPSVNARKQEHEVEQEIKNRHKGKKSNDVIDHIKSSTAVTDSNVFPLQGNKNMKSSKKLIKNQRIEPRNEQRKKKQDV